jgi:hypothetical protein
MADESLQTPDEENEILDPETEIPVRLDSLEADGTRPEVGDTVTIKIDGTVKKIENDYAYVNTDAVNDTDINDILADQQSDDEGGEDAMRRLTSQADQMGTPMGSGGPYQ